LLYAPRQQQQQKNLFIILNAAAKAAATATAATTIAARQAMTSKHIQQCHVVAKSRKKWENKNATKSFLLLKRLFFFRVFPCGGAALESSVTHTPWIPGRSLSVQLSAH